MLEKTCWRERESKREIERETGEEQRENAEGKKDERERMSATTA